MKGIYFCRHTAVLFLLLLPLSAEAQKKGFEPGYIISLEGDTLDGYTRDRTESSLYGKIKFQDGRSGKVRKYAPDKILGYSCGQHEFVSLPLYEESAFFLFRYYLDEHFDHVFLKVIARHESLTWYQQEWVDSESDYIDSFSLFHKPGSREMVRVSQGILGLKKKALTRYFQDCPDLLRLIENKTLSTELGVWEYYTIDCGF